MRRVWTALLGATVVAAGLPALAGPAEALQAPVAFISNSSSTYQTNGIAWSVAQAQGKVFVGGAFSSVRPPGAAKGTGEVPRSNLVVLDAATGAPTSCSPSVTDGASTATTTVKSLTVSPDGKTLYVGGWFGKVDGAVRYNLAALDIASCTFVDDFAPDPNSTVLAIAATAGAVYYGGVFNASDGVSRSHAAAAAAVGAPGTGTVLPWAPVMDQDVRALALRPGGGSVVAGGDFDTVNGVAAHALVVLDPDIGAVQKSWTSTGASSDFINPLSDVHDIAVDDTGFYTGHEGHGTGIFDGRMAIDWSTLSLRWRDTCLGATQAVVVYGGLLYSGSHAHNCGSMNEFPDGSRNHLLAESVDKPVLQPWFPQTNDGLGEALGPRDMVVAPGTSGDAMWVVGEFTTVNGVAQQGITRFGQGVDTAGPTSATTTVTSPRAGEARVAWRQSLDTDDALLTYRVYRDAETVPVTTVEATSWFWERRQMVFTDTGLAPGSKHSYRVEATDGRNVAKGVARSVVVGSSSSAYADRVLADGALSLWRYDEIGDVLVSDRTDRLANGTIRGTATFGAAGALSGDPSTAITLGGSTTTIYAEAPRTFTSSAPFTAETWIRTTTTVGGKIMGIGDKQTYQSAANDKHLYMTSSGQLVFGVTSSGAKTITSPLAYNDGQWHHVVASIGAGGTALYVDGGLVKANTAVKTSQTYTRGYLRVGGDKLASGTWPGASSEFWVGQLDETATYGVQLTAAQVKAHKDAAGTPAPADTTAPAAPAGVTATTSGQTVTVGWQAASDASGIAGYDVYRGASADVSTTGAPVATTTSATSATDTPGPGTWYYRVVARDGAGNASAPSDAAGTTVAPPPPTTTTSTVTVTASADSYGNAGAPSTTFGSSSSLSSRGSVGATSYLRFVVPDAPAGATLTGAALKLRTSTDAGAGSADAQTISLVPGAWDEATLTWNNRPALGAAVGTIPGGTTANTALTAALDPAQVGGSTVSLALSSSGTDVFWTWSRNYSTASARPQLVLTYSQTS